MPTKKQNGTDEEIKRVPLFRVGTQDSLDSPIDRRSDLYRQQARQLLKEHPEIATRKPQPLFTIPNILTFFRIILVPVLGMLYFDTRTYAPLACAIVFITASITDWLDGYLARRLKIATAFGAFLDPVADKIMVSTALVLLATSPPAPLSHKMLSAPVVIIIGREIAMSSLREWAAASGGKAHKAVKVNSLGKWKTALQMVAMSWMFFLRKAGNLLGDKPEVLDMVQDAILVSYLLLWGGACLALLSLYYYMANVWHFFRHPEDLKTH